MHTFMDCSGATTDGSVALRTTIAHRQAWFHLGTASEILLAYFQHCTIFGMPALAAGAPAALCDGLPPLLEGRTHVGGGGNHDGHAGRHLGFGRVAALHHRSPTSDQMR